MAEDNGNQYSRNYKGEDVSNMHHQLSDPSYGTGKYDENGDPIVNWPKYLMGNPSDGFLREEDGTYYHEIELPNGTHILRYGNEDGSHTAPIGTPYECLALPYVKETMEYNEYIVIADGVTVLCQVQKGIVAPSLDSPGMVIQYKHNKPIRQLCYESTLKRVELWKDI